jgi:type IV pilus assembly protein PilY1
MKKQRIDQPKAFPVKLLAASAALAFSTGLAVAETNLADVPLANSTTLAIPPNLALIIDDSGSMDEENMPGGNSSNINNYCYRWRGYNTLAYNPAITYRAPIKADGTRFPDTNFAAAPRDGYFPVNGTATMYDNNTINTNFNLNLFSSMSATVTFPDFGTSAYRATSVLATRPNNSTFELLATSPSPANGNTNEDTVGQSIRDSINANTATTGCTASYSTTNNAPVYGTLTVTCATANVKSGSIPAITLQRTSGTGTATFGYNAFTGPNTVFYATHKTDANSTNCAANANYDVVTDKANIAAPGVATGSAAALTNFANWYSYYRKRSFLMKAGVGEAFARLEEDKFRVGYFTISSSDSEVTDAASMPNADLAHSLFSGTTSASHRGQWYTKLYATKSAGWTPLRGALSRMGRIYSGKVAGWDPVQYSCQRNFALLTSDGYWNTDRENGSYRANREDNTTEVGDQDGVAGATRPERDTLATQNTLADVAYYYYHNDLRTSAKNNCTGAARSDASTGDVCVNDVPGSETAHPENDYATHQHMTTYTLGLGVTGTLAFDPSYKTLESGDYYDIKNGTAGNVCGPANNIACNWPNVGTDARKIDDLWHAAVNGRGLYLSAKNPTDLATGLATALNSMQAVTGAGSGAAAANLTPTTGSTAMYVAEYTTDEWWGDVAAYDFNVDTGEFSSSASWKAGVLLDARIGGAGNSDDRTIYTSVNGIRRDFTWANLSTQQRGYFDNTKLSQYDEWETPQLTAGTGEAMVNYLRGHNVNEDQVGRTIRLYRDRAHVLGDIVHSQPAYVKTSYNTFVADPTYGNRMGMLYVAANDGMLHAFCTESSGSCTPGKELWAYVIPPVMKNMWYLADKRQQGYHHYFVDGPLSVSDVQIGGQWRTLLVGGLGKGGRAYYAMDITDPADPNLLWTFAAEGADDIVNTGDDNPDLGYSYGLALSAQVGGNWRILVASGYNNIPNEPKAGDFPSADGRGHIFLLDPATGTVMDRITTGAGTPAIPSGLAQISTHVPNFTSGNVATKAYGGDLNGDMWRFDLVGKTAERVIGTGSPITTGTSISTTSKGHTVLLFGTGRYLGQEDLTDATQNYIVAVKADKTNLGLDEASKMLDRTGLALTDDPEEDMNWNVHNGWYRRLASMERVHVDPLSYRGYVLLGTVIPTGTECRPGGYGFMYAININSGTGTGTQLTHPPVGFTVLFDPNDKTGGGGDENKDKIIVIDATGDKIAQDPPPPPPPESAGKGTRIMWRELID